MSIISENPAVPICGVCSHRHVLGEKCSICGHVGQSQAFKRMVEKAANRRNISVVLVNPSSSKHLIHSSTSTSTSDEMQCIVNELLLLDAAEHDDQHLNYATMRESVYFLAFAGNSPVGYLNLSYVPEMPAVSAVSTFAQSLTYVIKRVYVVPARRRCKVALHCMRMCLLYMMSQSAVRKVGLCIPVPITDTWIGAKFHGFIAVAQSLAGVTGGSPPPFQTGGGSLLNGECTDAALARYLQIVDHKIASI